MIENEAKIIDKYMQYLSVNQIQQNEIADILDTICLLDTASKNAQPLDIDALHNGKDTNFSRIVNPTSVTEKELTDVGKLRLLSDSLFVVSQMHGIEIPQGVTLTLKASSELVKGYNAKEDATIEDCSKNLDLFFETLKKDAITDLSWYYELEKKLKHYDNLMREKYECNVELLESLRKKLATLNAKFPFKNNLTNEIELDKMNPLYRDNLEDYVTDTICYSLVFTMIVSLKKWVKDNVVYANFRLMNLEKYHFAFGTLSDNDLVPRIAVRPDFPSYMLNRILSVFDENASFDIDKLEDMIKVLIYMSSRHTTDIAKGIEEMN